MSVAGAPSAAPSLPWSHRDARSATLRIVVGVGVGTWGWWKASGTGDLDEQTTALMITILAAGVIVSGLLSWLLAGRRAVRARKAAITQWLQRVAPLRTVETTGVVDDPTLVDGATLIALTGSNRYHRGECLLVRGKDARELARDDREIVRRAPCEMCEP